MIRLWKAAALALLLGIAGTGLFAQCPAGSPPAVVTVTSATTSQATSCLQGPPSGSLTINGGSTVIWQAGTTVYLLPGFTAQAETSGTAFIASIGPMVTTTALPSGAVGTAYSATLAAGEGSSNTGFTWIVTGLPSPLSYNASTGQISGTPTSAGQFSITATATDSSGRSSFPQPLTLTLTSGLQITTSSLPTATPGSPYPSTTLQASGGELPYKNWQVVSGSLPSGLTLTSNGTISGTPTTSQTAPFTVQVSDSSNPNATASARLSINMGTVELTIIPPPPGDGTIGASYSASMSAIGGNAPYTYTWSVSAGALPAGLSLNAGTISGIPAATGLSTFTLQVTDGWGHLASEQFSVQINAAGSSTVTTREYIRMGSSVVAIEAAAGGAETVSPPSTPSGATNPTLGTPYTYSTGGSMASTGSAVQYQFNWGDGTPSSGWLPVGQTSTTHTWSSLGNWSVTAQAQDSGTHAQSNSSSPLLVTTDAIPTLTSLTPNTNTGGAYFAVFTAVVQDNDGSTSFNNASFVLGYWFHSAAGDCHFEYVPSAGLIYLDQGINSTWLSSGAPGSSGTSPSNGVCFIDYGASQAKINGTTLTVSVGLHIYEVAGTYTLSLSATNIAGTTGWTPEGSWVVPPYANFSICQTQPVVGFVCSPPGSNFVFGDDGGQTVSSDWNLQLYTNLPNTRFVAYANGQTYADTTAPNGTWGPEGSFTSTSDGSWQEYVVFSSPALTSNTISFTVGSN